MAETPDPTRCLCPPCDGTGTRGPDHFACYVCGERGWLTPNELASLVARTEQSVEDGYMPPSWYPLPDAGVFTVDPLTGI